MRFENMTKMEQLFGIKTTEYLPELGDEMKNTILAAYEHGDNDSELFRWFFWDLRFTRELLFKCCKDTDYLWLFMQQYSLAEDEKKREESVFFSVWAARTYLPQEMQREIELGLKRKYQGLKVVANA